MGLTAAQPVYEGKALVYVAFSVFYLGRANRDQESYSEGQHRSQREVPPNKPIQRRSIGGTR